MSAFKVTVTTSTLIVASNANRKRLWIKNLDTANVVYLSTTTAVGNQGVRLNPNGGKWETTGTSALYGYCPAGSAVVAGEQQ